jgi:hypothetical protein
MDCDLRLLAGKFSKNGKLSISKMKIDFSTGKIGLKFGPQTNFSKRSQLLKSRAKLSRKTNRNGSMKSRTGSNTYNSAHLDKSRIYKMDSQFSEV